MGTILASKIIADAAQIVYDPNYIRYSEDDYLGWLNLGQSTAAALKPDIKVDNDSIQLVEGAKQSIESTDVSLINITRNMGSDGSTPGDAIQLVNMEHMNRHNPDWPNETANATVKAFMFDPRDPRNYYVYPPQPGSSMGYVEKVVAVMPSDVGDVGSAIDIDDIYEPVLLDYIVYRALTIDGKQSPTAEAKAQRHWNLFVQGLGRKDLVEKIIEPREVRNAG